MEHLGKEFYQDGDVDMVTDTMFSQRDARTDRKLRPVKKHEAYFAKTIFAGNINSSAINKTAPAAFIIFTP